MKKKFPLLFVCVALVALSAGAAPIKRAHLSANPIWAMHVDFDALRQTYMGKYILYHMDKPEMYSNMMTFQSLFSFDLRTQLHGLTVYSDGPAHSDGVVLIYADFDRNRLVKLAREGQDAEATTNNQQVIYSWIDKNKNPDDADRPRSFAVIQNGFVIIGKDKERLRAALGVVNGTAPNLSTSKALPELAVTHDATFIQASARNLDFLGTGANVALLRMSKRANFRANELDEQFKAVLTLDAGDETTARQMSIAAQGLIALLRLQKDNFKAAKLADGLVIKQDGAALITTFSVPSVDLIGAIKTYNAEKEKLQAETK